MAQQRSVPPKLSLPPRHPQLSTSKTARFYPVFTPSSGNNIFMFSPSPTPTPSKRSRAPQGPLWLFTFVHMLSLYLLHGWLSASNTPPLAHVTFFPLLVAAVFLNIIYRPWKGRQIVSSQWALLFGTGAILALSYFLRFEGLQSCGPLETIFADFAGTLVGKVLFDSSNKTSGTARKARGLMASLVGVVLLSHGWAKISCSPLAVDISYRTRIRLINQPQDCVKVWAMFAPFIGGLLSAFQRMIGARTSLKSIGKKRIQVLSYALGSLTLFPFAFLKLALVPGQSPLQYGSPFWFVVSAVAFGMIIAFFSEFYTEEKLFLPVHSLKAFQIVTCCVCALELLYGLGISLVGFLFCSLVIGIGVQELSLLQGQLAWEELGDTSYGSLVYASWIRRPLQHIISDKKSRKIAIFLLINTAFMGVEFFYGFLRNSLGLISDACHMLFDCAALAIGLYASYISRLPENSKFNYGYGRFEVVSGYANAVLLVLVASLIVLESIERILEPPEISTESLLVVSVGGLLVNIVGLIFFHEEHHHAHGSGGHSCSHSHSSHKSAYSTQLPCKGAVVDISCGNSQLHNHHHSATITDNGHSFTTGGVEQGYGSLHESKEYSQTFSPHQCGSHDAHHHDHEGQFLNNGHHHDHQKHGLEHEAHVHHDHNQQHEDHQQCGSHHHGHSQNQHNLKDHSHHHGKSDFFDNHYHDHTSRHQDHSHKEDKDDDRSHDDHTHEHHHHHHNDHNHGHHGDNCDHHHHHDDHSHGHHDGNRDHDDHHHHHMDHNMYGIFLHVLADTLGSVGVVTSTLLIKYKGWLITDPACSIFLSALIIGSVVPLLRNSGEILLQRVPRHNEKSLKAACKEIVGLPGVRSVGRAHVWSFTNTDIVGSLHLQISDGSDRKLIQEKTLRLLHDAGIGDVTLQIEEVF